MSTQTNPPINPLRYIDIKGARTHNLKNLNLHLPHNQLIVITGPSGSGKSSLAFNTLFAEGQRRYMESLSAYARQFLAKIPKPAIDYIKGIPPSIGMQQKTHTHNPRSRVGTSTDTYTYLKLLYSRIGYTESPISGQRVRKHTVTDVTNYIQSQPERTKILIMAPLSIKENRTLEETLTIELRKGFTRLMHQDKIWLIQDLLNNIEKKTLTDNTYLIIDRLIFKNNQDEALATRLADSAQTAFFEGQGTCIVHIINQEKKIFSDRFEADGMQFANPSTHFFDFNNPYGACQKCGGLGKNIDIDPQKVVPNPALSTAQGAILPWQSHAMHPWQERLLDKSHLFKFPIHRPYKHLTTSQKNLLWQGNQFFKGINTFFKFIDAQSYKIQYRVLQARYRGTTNCTACRATGLRKETNYVKIGGNNLIDLLCMPINQLSLFFKNLRLTPHEQKVSKVLLEEIKKRLNYLQNVGLSYLTLHRRTKTLSGGEYQRIRLARALGSTLVDILYILDEPTVGLHPKDTDQLIKVLLTLKNAGNTVIVVEHEEAIIKVADQILDIGPEAGAHGGKLIFQGTFQNLLQANHSHTAHYLTGKSYIPIPKQPRKWKYSITLQCPYANNLQIPNTQIPLGILTVVTGVSGSGKSSLIQEVLYPALSHHLGLSTRSNNNLETIGGDLNRIQHVEQIAQNPLGISARSNPATYTKTYDTIRKIFATQPLSIQRNYTPVFFSFNTPGGRCETCKGTGHIKIEMQFLADVSITCESCKGKRFKKEVLEVHYNDKNIYQILKMTIEESITFFKKHPSITTKLQPLQDVGLGYITLGQPSSTFSGGEAQRLKLGTHLNKDNTSGSPTLFIFDEPTTGLHFRDTHKLMDALQRLIASGHTVIVIEHNTDVIKCADWIIDMGPGAGDQGGKIVFTGTPQQMINLQNNATAHYLRKKMNIVT